MIRTLAMAEAIAGTLGFPSKMPGSAFGIPASACNVGQKLHAVPDSVCAGCYAEKGNYGFKSTQASQANRLAKLAADQWVEAMVFMLRKAHGLDGGKVHHKITDPGWHRWHDSGDIQSESHLDAIIEVCRGTPEIRHWLPTREIGLVLRWLRSRHPGIALVDLNEVLIENLCIRFSATMIDGRPPKAANTSTVHRDSQPAAADRCVAPDHDGHCGPCRKCWDRSQANTSYHKH